MKVVVTGATGNVGTSVVEALTREPSVDQILGLARRLPDAAYPKTSFVAADVREPGLERIFDGADAVIHLAWLIQPSRDVDLLDDVNIRGTMRVADAVAAAGVPALIVASSVGAYAPGPKSTRVDEAWPTTGIPGSYYSRQKATNESLLNEFEREHPSIRVVRMRPAITAKGAAAAGIRRLFVGPLLPGWLARPDLLPVLPDVRRLRTQLVHSDDTATAYVRAALDDRVTGAFNLAAEPELDAHQLSASWGSRLVGVDRRLARTAVSLSWSLRLQPTHPSWFDMGLATPLMASDRARRELDWEPRHSAESVLAELLAGLREGNGSRTPPLDPTTGGTLRWREIVSGVGGRPG
jgi:nucleoside-diphosphate-sugar epimerase